jgi:hypothetical protein
VQLIRIDQAAPDSSRRTEAQCAGVVCVRVREVIVNTCAPHRGTQYKYRATRFPGELWSVFSLILALEATGAGEYSYVRMKATYLLSSLDQNIT